MAEVQGTRDVWGRDDNHKWRLCALGVRLEVTALLPPAGGAIDRTAVRHLTVGQYH